MRTARLTVYLPDMGRTVRTYMVGAEGVTSIAVGVGAAEVNYDSGWHVTYSGMPFKFEMDKRPETEEKKES